MHWKSLRTGFFLTSFFISLLSVSAEAGKYSSGGGRSYSSGGSSSRSSGSSSSSSSSSNRSSTGSSSFSRPSTPPPSRPSTPSYSSQRSSYSSGNAPATSSSFSRPTPPPSPNVDSAAAKAQKMQQSTQNFAQSRPAPNPTPAPAPKSTISSGGQSSPNYSSVRPQSLPAMPPRSSYSSRGNANTSNFSGGSSSTRVVRHYPAFSSYYNRPVVVYQDSYSSPFWYWLLDQPRPVRAAWYYHHRSDMDPARQTALVAADPALTQEVAQVAAVVPTPDPGYAPPGIEPQAMTEPVEMLDVPAEEAPAAAHGNALPATPAIPHVVTRQNVTHSRSSSFLSMFILIGGGIFVLWLVFFKRWKPAAS
jgi:hypothetical protein